ncbi:MAG: hypothetical protein AAF357_01140 [Verrucomicrobiota bacterium]
MLKVTAALLLVLWTSCYLNCSMEHSGVCADSLISSVETSDSCPLDEDNDAPDTCEDGEFILLSEEGVVAPETPVTDVDDRFDALTRALAALVLDEAFSPSSSPSLTDPAFSLSEQDCARASLPIRGPNV